MSINTLLVANRGEIARRVMRTAHEMGIRCIAIYVDADVDAPFVRDADAAMHLATGYLDSEAIIQAALNSGADAVHPGYGFLSENARFAAAVQSAGLIWVGPTAEAISSMGDKLAAKKLAVAAGVPTLEYSADPADAERIGYPVLVKAAAGGGGKGMRVVHDPAHLLDAVAGARREAAHAFGDDTVFIEHYVASSRHVEIQILGDAHGNLIHLGERECSIQRRHQKLVEESPSSVVDEKLRAAMGGAALNLGRAMGYQSAGTVEFLVDNATKEFFFLEVNTRLQVEHPVTEEVTGIDLVREQLRVANGDSLSLTQDEVCFSGHAIEVRLCAEDPVAGFLPATGTLAAFIVPDAPVVRWESGVETGSVVGVAFDPLLAKVIAHGPTRLEAASRLALALEGLHLGGVTTNRDFLAATLRHPAFLAGDTTTDFIERHQPALALQLNEEELRWLASAAALWLQGESRAAAKVLASAPSGWRNARLPAQKIELRFGEQVLAVHYRTLRDGSFEIDGKRARVFFHDRRGLDVEVDGRRAKVAVTRANDQLYVQSLRGTINFEIAPRFVVPGHIEIVGGLNAPMPGTVLAIYVQVGDVVAKGTTLMVLEAMKMEHLIVSPSDGQVAEILVELGQQVENGASLLVLDEITIDGSDGQG